MKNVYVSTAKLTLSSDRLRARGRANRYQCMMMMMWADINHSHCSLHGNNCSVAVGLSTRTHAALTATVQWSVVSMVSIGHRNVAACASLQLRLAVRLHSFNLLNVSVCRILHGEPEKHAILFLTIILAFLERFLRCDFTTSVPTESPCATSS